MGAIHFGSMTVYLTCGLGLEKREREKSKRQKKREGGSVRSRMDYEGGGGKGGGDAAWILRRDVFHFSSLIGVHPPYCVRVK